MSNQGFTEFEHRGWQRVADKYDSTWASSTRQFIAPLLDAVEVSDKMSILDVGCGPGYVSAAAAERGATAVGLDFSSAMIAIARQNLPRINFHEGDAQNLPFDNETFDRVVANFALLHLAEPERAFAEAFRVLKHGGKFGFTTWARGRKKIRFCVSWTMRSRPAQISASIFHRAHRIICLKRRRNFAAPSAALDSTAPR
jgi:ubiquinone/menaquinone biosynthesis C-methylase UbiE